MYAQMYLHKPFLHFIIFHLANQSRYVKICKAAALQCDSKTAAVSVTAATELLGGNKFLLGLLSLRFSFLLGTIFWNEMIVNTVSQIGTAHQAVKQLVNGMFSMVLFVLHSLIR